MTQPADVQTTYEAAIERDVMVAMRDGVRLATDVYRPMRDGKVASGQFPVSSNARPTAKRRRSVNARRSSSAPPSRGTRRLFRRARLRRRIQDLPRPLSLGGPLHEIPQRSRGRLRHARLARATALVQRPHRHVRPVVSAHTADGARTASTPRGWRRMFLDCGGFSNAYRSGIRHGGAFDLKQATWAYRNALWPACAADPDVRAGAGSRGHRRLDRGRCRGSAATRHCAGRRNTRTICSSSGRTAPSTITGSSRASTRRVFYDAYAGVPWCTSCGLVRPVRADRDRQLLGHLARRERGRAADPGAVDAWRPLAELLRATSISVRTAPVDGNLAEDFFEFRRAGSTVGSASTTASSARGALSVMGGGSGRRNPTDGSIMAAAGAAPRLAAARDALDAPLSARRRVARARERPIRRGRPSCSTSTRRSGADDRRRDHLGRAGDAAPALRPAHAARMLFGAPPPYLPLAARPRRARLRHAAAR